MQELQRPGGELATRPIHFFWVVDCSGSMYGEKIGIVNNTIQECIPEMRNSADNNPNAQLSIPPMPARALPPVIVLLSDGQPTDDYKKSLDKLKGMPWFRKAVKIAISIGQDADDDVLIEFTGNKELVLQANNATALAKMIKWASTTASMVSAPSSKPMNSILVSAPAASTPSAAASVPADDPFAPANNGAPLVLDMSNIPNPDDFDEGAVW